MGRTRIRLNNKLNRRNMGLSKKEYLGFAFAPLAIWLYFIICYIVNIVKLVNCDFEGPFKEEIIHAIGLIGPAAGITAWF